MSMQQHKIEKLSALLGETRGTELVIGGIPVTDMASRVATPFYVYNGDVVAEQIQRVTEAIGRETQLVFSVKANPSLGLCQVIARQGIGCEVASVGELLLAQKAGFPVHKILFIGPGKTDEELEFATELGIKAVIVESSGELERLELIASRLKKPVNVGIRVNVKEPIKGYKMRMGGGAQQFGIDEEQLPEVLERFKHNSYAKVIGLHVYAGSQMFDIDALLEHCNYVVDLGAAMAEQLGTPLAMMDLGGGFGVPYFDNTSDFDLDAFRVGFEKVRSRCKAGPRLRQTELVIELGRYLVAECGLYVTKVLDVKSSRGKKFVVTDGGMNHHVAATGNFGQVFRKPYPIAALNRMDSVADERAAIVGPNCTPLDVFAQDIPFCDVQIGDLLGVFYSGAYGYSASGLGFLSHPTPAELMVWEGNLHILRDPGTPSAFLRDQYDISDSKALLSEAIAGQGRV